MERYICIQCFIQDTSSVHNVDTLTYFTATIPFPKMETEYYLWQSIGNILSIMIMPKNQIPLLTYGDTKQAQSNLSPRSWNTQSLTHQQSSIWMALPQTWNRKYLCYIKFQWMLPQSAPLFPLPQSKVREWPKSDPIFSLSKLRGWSWNLPGERISLP